MHRLIIAAALLTSGAAIAADSSTFQLRDAQDLVTACSVPADHTLHANATGFCHGVLVGAYTYYNSTVTAENSSPFHTSTSRPSRAAIGA